MNLARLCYDAAWRLSGPVLAVAARFSPKLSRALEGRRESVAHFRSWAIGRRTRSDRPPLLLLHGASAGELGGVRPIIETVRSRLAGLEVAVSYSSPSGEVFAPQLRPDVHGYIPLDRSDHMGAFLDALQPSVLVFAKLDVWPTLTLEARARDIPICLVNATVRPDSTRLRFPARRLMRAAYRAIRSVGAVSEQHAGRLESLGVEPSVIRVTGDGSFDRALQAARTGRNREPRLPARPADRVRLIAGSTWRADEKYLLASVGRRADFELIIVPHEPDPEVVARLEALVLAETGAAARIWSREPGGGPADAGRPLVVDAVGFLAELYAEADVAYVGGGLDGTGLHSVIEPAAAGRPVLFGSRHDRWEARELIEAGGASEMDGASEAWIELVLDPARRQAMGSAARTYVQSRAGASTANADLIMTLLDRA